MARAVIIFLLWRCWLASTDVASHAAADASASVCTSESCFQKGARGTQGNSCLQKASVLKKVSDSGEARDGPSRPTAEATLPNTHTELVAITYCDAKFARIWQTFIRCYEKALGCEVSDGQQCQNKTRLLDLGLIDQDPGEKHCTRTRRPAIGLSEMSNGVGSRLRLTPDHVPLLICDGIVRELKKGNHVLRLDADAFLFENPVRLLQEAYPDADIVSSVDCAASPRYCDWYHNRVFRRRHRNRDPLARVGFMMNTGLTYIRSNARTVALVEAAAKALRKGKASYEQVALNEELVRRRCRWQSEDGHSSPGRMRALALLGKKAMIGRCAGGLRVVVLPYRMMTRSLDDAPNAISYHPGGRTSEKMEVLPQVQAMCEERASRESAQVSETYLHGLRRGRDKQTV
mmetsp:Transcript_100001/g.173523  ORF Transcript_100001/g.173523 Transcript_100001/m.173523 type:complete len:403 (+) Transcript_100001:59-1267(+)